MRKAPPTRFSFGWSEVEYFLVPTVTVSAYVSVRSAEGVIKLNTFRIGFVWLRWAADLQIDIIPRGRYSLAMALARLIHIPNADDSLPALTSMDVPLNGP